MPSFQLRKAFFALIALGLAPPSRQGLLRRLPVYEMPPSDVLSAEFWDGHRLAFAPPEGVGGMAGKMSRVPCHDFGLPGIKHTFQNFASILGFAKKSRGRANDGQPTIQPNSVNGQNPIFHPPKSWQDALAELRKYVCDPTTYNSIPEALEGDREERFAQARIVWQALAVSCEGSAEAFQSTMIAILPEGIDRATRYMLLAPICNVQFGLWMHLLAAASRIGATNLPFTRVEIAISLALKNLALKFGSSGAPANWIRAFSYLLHNRRVQTEVRPELSSVFWHNLDGYLGAREILAPELGVSYALGTWETLRDYIKFDHNLATTTEAVIKERAETEDEEERLQEPIMLMAWRSAINTVQSKTAAVIVLYHFSKQRIGPFTQSVASSFLDELKEQPVFLLPETLTLLNTIDSPKSTDST